MDRYIADAMPFAQPILIHFRNMIHQNAPGVEEKIKWGAPHFDYKGPLANMAAFKAHCAAGFWKGSLLTSFTDVLETTERNAMGNLGRLTSMDDLPDDTILGAIIMEACRLNDEKIKRPGKPKVAATMPDMPPTFHTALNAVPIAREYWDAFTPAAQKDYLEWIIEAKTDATRDKRVATTVEWVSEGKKRHWKYMR